MTNNDIIKALERCTRDYCHTSECPVFNGTTSEDCRNELIKSALDLINRQKAEIERLVQEKDNLIKTYKECMTEAITEFAERLKDNFRYGWLLGSAVKTRIDQIAKEMKEGVGE